MAFVPKDEAAGRIIFARPSGSRGTVSRKNRKKDKAKLREQARALGIDATGLNARQLERALRR